MLKIKFFLELCFHEIKNDYGEDPGLKVSNIIKEYGHLTKCLEKKKKKKLTPRALHSRAKNKQLTVQKGHPSYCYGLFDLNDLKLENKEICVKFTPNAKIEMKKLSKFEFSNLWPF